MYKIELVNKKTKAVTIFDDVADVNYGEKLFFKFQINATELEDGEYILSLFEDGELLLTDTLCVGDFDVSGLQYKRGDDIYIETILDAITEDKVVTITSYNEKIIPSKGVDAMTSVVVDAQSVYNDGYSVGKEDGITEGYADGKTDGITEGYDRGYGVGLEEGIEDGIRIQKGKLEDTTITANGVYSTEDGYGTVTVEVPDVNGSYDEGFADGKNDGYTIGYGQGYDDGTADAVANAGTIVADTAQVLNITENGIYTTRYSKAEDAPITDENLEGNLIRTVNVNVVPKINPLEYNLAFGNSTFTTLPPIFELPSRINTDKIQSFFDSCQNLTDISCFEGVEEFYWTQTYHTYQEVFYLSFQYCEKLEDISPLRNIRLVVDDSNFTSVYKTPKFKFSYAFLKTAVTDFTPLNNIFDNITRDYTFDAGNSIFASSKIKRFELDWDWSKCTNYYQMLGDSKVIEYIQELDATLVTTGYNPLDVISLTSGTADALTYFGGYRNQKLSITSNYFLPKCPNLTKESCLAILNNLYDFVGNGETPTTNQGKLKVHSNFLTTVGDDLAIGTNKGWTITS